MKKKYIILLSCLAVLILLLCFVEADYQTYLRETSEATAIVEVKEGLSINYIDGKSFEVNSPSKSITFSVTNLTEDNVDYYIHINNVVGDITGVIYELSEAESEDVISNEFGTSSVLSESISAGATERYTLMVRNPSNRDFTFDLNVRDSNVLVCGYVIESVDNGATWKIGTKFDVTNSVTYEKENAESTRYGIVFMSSNAKFRNTITTVTIGKTK